ncbi:MAG: hypothetical protein ACLPUG_09450 [Acidimicrobiales bacterium]
MGQREIEIAEALKQFTPPAEAPSEGFLPLIDRGEHRTVSTKDYRPVNTPTVKVSGQLAVDLIQDDMAMEGFKLVEVKDDQAVFVADPDLKARADLRKSYQEYRNLWGDGAARRNWNGVPDSPAEYCRKIAAGEPMYPQPYEPPPKDPVQARFEALEAEVKRLSAMTAKYPA